MIEKIINLPIVGQFFSLINNLTDWLLFEATMVQLLIILAVIIYINIWARKGDPEEELKEIEKIRLTE